MGQFSDAVLTLLDAFSSGLAIIKSLRRQRKEAKAALEPQIKAEEARLGKSLRKDKAFVQDRYSRNLTKFGNRFATGDVEAQSSLTSILFRLNAGLVAIIDRFTRGESTRSDYQTLVHLSNASRVEAIKTFGQLSTRIPRSSGGLAETTSQRAKKSRHSESKVKRGQSSSTLGITGSKSRSRSKSAPELSPPSGRNGSGELLSSASPKAERKKQTGSTNSLPSTNSRSKKSRGKDPSSGKASDVKPFPKRAATHLSKRRPKSHTNLDNRMSIMSFSSGSTQLGEIPNGKLARTAKPNPLNSGQFAAFPLAPWKESEKPRNRFMRLFRR